MPNDIKLQEGHPVDENLRPLKVGDKTTALELAQNGNGARITGGLEVSGTGKSIIAEPLVTNNIISSSDITLKSDVDINLTATTDINIPANVGLTFGDDGEKIEGDGTNLTILSSGHMILDCDGGVYLDSGGGLFYFRDNGDTNDLFAITVAGGTGATSLETVSEAADGHLSLVADGSIILNSPSGGFEMHGGGTTAKFADMYAGMILGYTVIGLDATPSKFDVTASMLPVHDDLKVSFVFPPSGKVEIMASIYQQTTSGRPTTWGLSTTDASTGFTSLGAKYENQTYTADETDGEQHEHRWYVTGTAGDSEELWFAAGATQAGRVDLYWGGDSSSVADASHPMEYQPFVMRATALPSTVYTG